MSLSKSRLWTGHAWVQLFTLTVEHDQSCVHSLQGHESGMTPTEALRIKERLLAGEDCKEDCNVPISSMHDAAERGLTRQASHHELNSGQQHQEELESNDLQKTQLVSELLCCAKVYTLELR